MTLRLRTARVDLRRFTADDLDLLVEHGDVEYAITKDEWLANR